MVSLLDNVGPDNEIHEFRNSNMKKPCFHLVLSCNMRFLLQCLELIRVRGKQVLELGPRDCLDHPRCIIIIIIKIVPLVRDCFLEQINLKELFHRGRDEGKEYKRLMCKYIFVLVFENNTLQR